MSCPSSNRADGKHPRGLSGCGCPDDPEVEAERAKAGNPDGTGSVKKPSARCGKTSKNMNGRVAGVARHADHVCGENGGHHGNHRCNIRGCNSFF